MLRALVVVAALATVLASAQNIELKHSFQAPFDDTIPFWAMKGGARHVDKEFVRLTPDKQSRLGLMWNSVPVTEMTDWEVTIEFQVFGQPKMGADGFAFWFAEQPNLLGPVYGSTDYWQGLGVFFDTFNNDGVGDFPSVVAVVNDGRLQFDDATDGASQAIGSCSMAFRQRSLPSHVRIRYKEKVLTVDFSLNRDGAWTQCFSVPDLELGVDKYFGLTAQTGDLADNHDVYSFTTRNLSPAGVDVEAVRRSYKAKVHQQSKAESKADTERALMSPSEFQNIVMDQLNQIQSAQNLLEMSMVALVNMMDNKAEPNANTNIGGNTNRNYDAGSAGDGATADAINELSRKIHEIADKLENPRSGIASKDAAVGSARELTNLFDNQRTLINTGQNIEGQLGNIVRKLDELARSSGGSGESVSRDDVRRSVENALDRSAIVKQIKELAGNVRNAVEGGGGGGGGGWFSSLLFTGVGVAIGAVISYFTNKSSRNPYKLP